MSSKTQPLFSMLRVAADQGNKEMLQQLIGLLETEVNALESGNQLVATISVGSTGSVGAAVAYGKDGYTDAYDPRAENARRHSEEGKPCDACWLIVHANTQKQYRCKSVRVLGEVEGGGKHVAWVHQPGTESVVLATGYNGDDHSFDQRILHAAGQELVINGKFIKPALGPLAIFLERNGQIISDVIGSIGLPNGSHLCYEVVFEAR